MPLGISGGLHDNRTVPNTRLSFTNKESGALGAVRKYAIDTDNVTEKEICFSYEIRLLCCYGF